MIFFSSSFCFGVGEQEEMSGKLKLVEREMREEFGEAYDIYAENTPAFIPHLFRQSHHHGNGIKGVTS